MLAVKGVYTGERTVQLEKAAPLSEGYEVIVTFVNPPAQTQTNKTVNDEQDGAEAAYRRLLKYKGTLHRHIDYKKELAEYREEKYGHTH
jgi:CRISPR/Cas system CMR-associated protein Cmr1 (group 7 of RAMP superfamily)